MNERARYNHNETRLHAQAELMAMTLASVCRHALWMWRQTAYYYECVILLAYTPIDYKRVH